jgi:glycosyltransferase involved in cell wall biosynthesis
VGIRGALECEPAEREAIGREARRLVLESFTWDRNVAAVLEHLRAATVHER